MLPTIKKYKIALQLPAKKLKTLMESAQRKTETQDVKVQLLLAGGHQYSIWLKSDSPVLENLLKLLVARTQNQTASTLLQIPINEGHGALCFTSDNLVGLITEPPIFVQQKTAPATPTAEVKQATPPPNIVVSECLQLDNFLTAEQNKRLVEYALANESAFVPTTTSTGAADYRRSFVLHSFPEFYQLMINRINEIVPTLFSKFGVAPFTVSQIEAQLTAHNDGNFYKIHNDSGSPETATRTLTYVYYFNREPKAFSGGELVLYDSKIENNFYVKANSFKTVEPRNNSVVFFLSRNMHEVLPVSCPSKNFADSRFTINGWVRR